MNKKLLSLVLALVMCLGLCVPAFATVGDNAAEAVPELKFFTIEVGKTEATDKDGNVFQLSTPVLRIEEKTRDTNTYDCSVVPVGTAVTVIKADGTKPEEIGIGSGEAWWTDENPYTIKSEGVYEFSSGPDTLTVFAVASDEAGDTTPAPDAKPDETKPDDAKPEETKSDDAKPVETKPEETKPVENPFTDVKEGDYFYEPVLWAVEKEITTGTTDTTFTPERNCTVSEILTFLWRAAGSPEAAIENPYTDGTESAWYAGAVIWAHEKGMITGETFPADEPCTRASTAVYLWQAAGSPEAGKAAEFTDVAADADYAAAVAWAVENAVTTGTSDTTFSPGDTCTRGQIATFLYRAFADQQ